METIADTLFKKDIEAGSVVRLGDLVDDSGALFSGISDDGTWIVALTCGSCANPAPWFLSVLEVCSKAER
jgi:hypothetical protein